MANINKIRLSGTTYNIEDENASKTVELTQAQYDALATKEPNTYYVITDATAVDIANYYTKTETDTALATKQATLVSGTNIKTINNESILGSGNIEIQGGGGSVTVDDALSTTSENPVQNKVIANAINAKQDKISSSISKVVTDIGNVSSDKKTISIGNTSFPNGGTYYSTIDMARINGNGIVSVTTDFSLVETSAITTSMNSSSTDAQVPSAKAVYDALGGLKLISLTQAQYDALSTKDASTIYFING